MFINLFGKDVVQFDPLFYAGVQVTAIDGVEDLKKLHDDFEKMSRLSQKYFDLYFW